MAMQMAGRRVALAVGIILVAVSLVAIISIAKQRGEAARHEEMTRIASEQHTAQSDDKKASDSTAKQQQEAAKQEAAKQEAEKKALEEQKATEEATRRQAEAQQREGLAISEMPQTGPADLLTVIPVGLAVFAVASYVESRRRLV